MASLNEQMDGMLESSFSEDPTTPKPNFYEKMQRKLDLEDKGKGKVFVDKEGADEKIQSTVTGMAFGSAAIPSDTITMASDAANFINKDSTLSTMFPITSNIAPYLDKVNKLAGRPGFEELLKALGIKSDPANTNQIVGEILSPGFYFPAFKGAIKLSKAAGKAFDDLGDLFKGGDGTGGAKFATQSATSNNVSKAPQIDDFNQPQINLNEVGLNTVAGKKGYIDYIGAETKAMGGTYTPERYTKLSLVEKEKLYIETGVYRGSDGKPRYKISTADAQLQLHNLNEYDIVERGGTINAKNIPAEGLTLREVLNHEDLYKQYPNDIANATKRTEYTKSIQYGLIENIKIKNFDTYIKEKNLNYEEAMAKLKKTQAIYSRHEGVETIYIRSGKLADVRSVLLHEVQHAVQHREGFLAGASPQKFLYDPKTEFGQTYIANEKNIIASKNEALSTFEKPPIKKDNTEYTQKQNEIFKFNTELNIEYEKNKELFESVTDKLVKREYNTFTGNDRFLSRNNMLVEDVPKETYRGSGVYIDRKPKIYQGYDTSNVIFNKEEMDLANNLSSNKVFQDYIKKRIFIEKTVQEQKLMESEAHKLYIKEPGEMEAVKVQTDDQRYVLKLRENGYNKGDVVPKDVQERIFRELKPGLLQGDVVPTVGTNANTSASIRK